MDRRRKITLDLISLEPPSIAMVHTIPPLQFSYGSGGWREGSQTVHPARRQCMHTHVGNACTRPRRIQQRALESPQSTTFSSSETARSLLSDDQEVRRECAPATRARVSPRMTKTGDGCIVESAHAAKTSVGCAVRNVGNGVAMGELGGARHTQRSATVKLARGAR